MSLYSQYIKEREDFDTIESDKGFATFKCVGNECYLRDIYVTPAYRNSNIASQMADKISEIAKERKCTYLIGTISANTNKPTESLKVLLAYGFKLIKSTPELVYMVKELK